MLPALLASGVLAQGATPPTVRVDVFGHYENAVGTSDAASQGTITRQLIEDRPLLRPGEVLEYVPGVIITQHSGAGKANQYFLRGFNLDHGTDFATTVAGMPVNLRTHGHGQGYTDLNFLIPELIGRIDYGKGPYYAARGDFASAGYADIRYSENLPSSLAEAALGSFDYRRAVLVGSPAVGPGRLTYGFEYVHNDGPWDHPDDFRKVNGVLRYFVPVGQGQFGVTAMAYSGKWDATDQIPGRAVDDGRIGRFGSLDTTTGGRSHRYSLSADYRTPLAGGEFKTTAYAYKYDLSLFSNFTYVLADPENGDQFEQADDRRVYGWTGKWTSVAQFMGRPTKNTIGFELRQDRIDPVGLYATAQRQRLSTVREDRVRESSVGIYVQNDTQWNDWFRSIVGLRGDRYRFNVDGPVPENTGKRSADIGSPKMSLVFGPWQNTEYFVNAGTGFHSNDARGVTTRVDPVTGDALEPATPLVRTRGAELGLRTKYFRNLQSSLALWYLELDSELVFIGDAGNTEASRPSRRRGIEWSNRYTPTPWLLVDLDVSLSRARFKGDAPEGNFIPGALKTAVSAGATLHDLGPWSAAAFLRYFGPRPLIEDNSAKSGSSTIVNVQAGYQINKALKVRLDVFNLFDRKVDDITYFYESRLPGEPPEGVVDFHFHPAEKRSYRVSLAYAF